MNQVDNRQFIFDIQLFSDGEQTGQPQAEPVNVDAFYDSFELQTTKKEEPVQETVQPEPEPQEPSSDEPTVTEPEKEEEPKFKVKVRGEEKEYPVSKLIELAQQGEDYTRKTQELAMQRRAFEMALQAQQQQVKPPDPADELKQYQTELDNYAMTFKNRYGIEFNEFDPVHTSKFAEYRLEQRQAQQSQEAQVRLQQEADAQYVRYSQEFLTDTNAKDIIDSAIKNLYSLPSKGADGIDEFRKLYPIYQKIEARDAYIAAVNQGYQPSVRPEPLTMDEVISVQRFFGQAKKDYYARKFTPKTATTKSPVASERPGNGDVDTTPKFDYNKISSMKGDDLNMLYQQIFDNRK